MLLGEPRPLQRQQALVDGLLGLGLAVGQRVGAGHERLGHGSQRRLQRVDEGGSLEVVGADLGAALAPSAFHSSRAGVVTKGSPSMASAVAW